MACLIHNHQGDSCLVQLHLLGLQHVIGFLCIIMEIAFMENNDITNIKAELCNGFTLPVFNSFRWYMNFKKREWRKDDKRWQKTLEHQNKWQTGRYCNANWMVPWVMKVKVNLWCHSVTVLFAQCCSKFFHSLSYRQQLCKLNNSILLWSIAFTFRPKTNGGLFVWISDIGINNQTW